MLRCTCEKQKRKIAILEVELKDSKQKMKELRELEQRHWKETVAERNKSQMMARRIDGLEKGLLFLNDTSAPQIEDNMLKNTLNIMMREN